ncbi:MAG: 50S ribosomal protein L29 [Acidimicrobiales bacterium]
MASKSESFRDLDDAGLVQALADTKEALFNLRFQNATGQLDNHASLREARRNVARINTELRAREIAAAEALETQRENA